MIRTSTFSTNAAPSPTRFSNADTLPFSALKEVSRPPNLERHFSSNDTILSFASIVRLDEHEAKLISRITVRTFSARLSVANQPSIFAPTTSILTGSYNNRTMNFHSDAAFGKGEQSEYLYLIEDVDFFSCYDERQL